jgi:hypothetical protein
MLNRTISSSSSIKLLTNLYHLISLQYRAVSRYQVSEHHREQFTGIMASKYTEQNGDKVKEAHSTLYDAGLEMRNKVAGKEYVDRALANATSDFARPMQEVHSAPNITPLYTMSLPENNNS